jgi:hypothetical protein
MVTGIIALYQSALVAYNIIVMYSLFTIGAMYAIMKFKISTLGYLGILATQTWCLVVLHAEYTNYVQILRIVFFMSVITAIFSLGEYTGCKTILTAMDKKYSQQKLTLT